MIGDKQTKVIAEAYLNMLAEAKKKKDDKVEKVEKELEKVVSKIEEAKTNNEGYGYHGKFDSEKADDEFNKAHAAVKSVVGDMLKDHESPTTVVRDYLDSARGRHLSDLNDSDYIKKDFGKFMKKYKPELFESDKGTDEEEDESCDSNEYGSDSDREDTKEKVKNPLNNEK